MATNLQKRASNMLLVLGALTLLAVVIGAVVARTRRAEAAAKQAEATRAAEAEVRRRRDTLAQEKQAAEKLAVVKAASEKQRAENQEKLRRRFLILPGEKSPPTRPTALVVFRNDKPDLQLAANIATRLAQKGLRANPAIFTAEFADEFVRRRIVTNGPTAEFLPSEYAMALVAVSVYFKDGLIELPTKMNNTQLEVEMRWHEFTQGTSELLWHISTKGVGFSVKDAQEQALDRAFDLLDARDSTLVARIGADGRSQ